jgi:hypothetical protein
MPPVSPPAAPTSSAETPETAESWEERIGGQWLNWLGAVTLVFAVGLFLKWAYDMGWITPLLQLPPIAYLALGWIIGAGLLAGAERLRERVPLYAQGLAGAGIAVLYLTTYAGHALYDVLSAQAATLGLVLVGAAAIASALRHDSVVIGWIGIVLAYVSPVLLGGKGSGPGSLFLYLTALNCVVLGISVARRWVAFRAAGFAATALLYLTWHLARFTPVHLEAALLFVAANSAIFLGVLALYPLVRGEPTRDSDLALAVLNPLLAGTALYGLMRLEYADWMGLVAAVFAAVYWLLARAIRARRGEEDYVEQLFFATAVVFAILAVPLQFPGSRVMTASWALMGAALSVVGFNTGSRRTRNWGAAAIALALARLAFRDAWLAPAAGAAMFFNERGFSFAVVAAALGVAGALYAREWRASERQDGQAALRLAGTALLVSGVMGVWMLLDLPGEWVPAGWAAGAALALAYGWQLRCLEVRVVASVFALLPVLAVLTGAAEGPPYVGWAACLALCLGAAAAYLRSGPERLPDRPAGLAYAAAAAALLLTRSHADLPPVWIPVAWAVVAGAALAVGFGRREIGYRVIGWATGAAAFGYLIHRHTEGLLLGPWERAPGFAAVLLLFAGLSWACLRTSAAYCDEDNPAMPGAAAAAAVTAMFWGAVELDAGWLPLSWLLVAGALLCAGVRTDRAALRLLGLGAAVALTAEVVLRELGAGPGHPVLLHSRTAAALAAITAWMAGAWVFYRFGTEWERNGVPGLVTMVNLQALGWLSIEAMDVAGRAGPRDWAREAAQFGLSAVWTLYGAGAILVGFLRQRREVRWGGMALLLLTVAKVYAFDLGFLALGYRVLSFLVLALILLGVSYLYQRSGPTGRRPAAAKP